MIIFGTRVSASPRDVGDFACPRCQSMQPYQEFVNRRWFTLYFIPVIPMGTAGEYVQCFGCGSQFDPQVLTNLQTISPAIANARETPEASVVPWTNSPAVPAPTSALAITSLVFALISPVVSCMCGLSLVTSLIAIVTGHMSLVGIKRSAGQLAGRGVALAGVIVGYVMFAISLLAVAAFLPGFLDGWRQAERQHATSEAPAAADGSERLLDAEMKVMTSSTDGAATGNSPAARALAEDYSASLKGMRETLFTADERGGISLTQGQFVTHCELHDGRCAFIVHVPAYRKFDDDAKESLAQIAWSVAQETVQSTLRPGDSLAVGLRGAMLYGAVLVGQVAGDDQQQVVYQQGERDDLLSFFLPPAVDAVPAMEPGRDESEMTAGESEVAETSEAATVRSEAAAEARDASTPRVPEKSEADVEDRSSGASIPVRRSPMTRKLVVGPLIPGMESPDHFSDNQPPPGPVAGSPAEPRPAAPTIEPKTEKNQAPAAKIVQQFPEMGWSVESLAFAPNGRWLAAGKLDRSLLVLDVETGTTSSRQEDLDELGQVVQVAFSPDGQYIVALGYSGAVMRWSIDEAGSLTDGQTLSRHGGRLESLAISPTAPLLMMGASDGSLIWQSYTDDTNQSRRQKYLSRGAIAVHFAAQGTEARATDGEGLVRIDLRSSQQLETRQLQHASVRAAAFSADGSRLAVSTGYEISVWVTATGQSLCTLEADHETQWSVAFLRDGRQLISGGRGQATLWDLENGQAIARFDLGNVLYIKTLAVSPDETLLATIPASAGQTLSVFQIPD